MKKWKRRWCVCGRGSDEMSCISTASSDAALKRLKTCMKSHLRGLLYFFLSVLDAQSSFSLSLSPSLPLALSIYFKWPWGTLAHSETLLLPENALSWKTLETDLWIRTPVGACTVLFHKVRQTLLWYKSVHQQPFWKWSGNNNTLIFHSVVLAV